MARVRTTTKRRKTIDGVRFEKVVDTLKKHPHVAIGVQSADGGKKHENEDGSAGSITLADLASIHEFGAPKVGIPERSFIRSNDAENAGKYRNVIAKMREQIIFGRTSVRQALGLLGELVQSDIKARIRAGIAPPLKEATIRAKNAGVIEKAHGTINSLERKYNERAYKGALKNGGRGRGYLTPAETARENKAADIILTGGKSVPLIDTGQLINSIRYKVNETKGEK